MPNHHSSTTSHGFPYACINAPTSLWFQSTSIVLPSRSQVLLANRNPIYSLFPASIWQSSYPFSYFNIFSALTNAMGQIGTWVAADAIHKFVVAPRIQQIDDVIHLDRNCGVLRAKLESMKLFLQDICNGFQNQQRAPPESIRNCLDSKRDTIAEAKGLIDMSQMQQRCLDCIFCKPRIPRQIREWNSRVDQVGSELLTIFSIFATAQQIGSSSAQSPAKELLQPLPDWGIVGKDIKSVETQLHTWPTEASQLRIIGLYEIAGVGKASLLKSLYNLYKLGDVFDVVMWVTVSQNFKISDLQGCIPEVINLDVFRTSDIDNRKMKLSAGLKNKKFLLMLDDMWSALDFQKLGVVFGTDKGSKVVLSAGSRDLGLIEAEQSIKVEPYSRDEGWALFKRVAFRCGYVPEDLKESTRNRGFEGVCQKYVRRVRRFSLGHYLSGGSNERQNTGSR